MTTKYKPGQHVSFYLGPRSKAEIAFGRITRTNTTWNGNTDYTVRVDGEQDDRWIDENQIIGLTGKIFKYK